MVSRHARLVSRVLGLGCVWMGGLVSGFGLGSDGRVSLQGLGLNGRVSLQGLGLSLGLNGTEG
jgi:hypothetical protein